MKRRCRETGACLDREKLGLFYFFKFSINPEIADISQPKPIIINAIFHPIPLSKTKINVYRANKLTGIAIPYNTKWNFLFFSLSIYSHLINFQFDNLGFAYFIFFDIFFGLLYCLCYYILNIFFRYAFISKTKCHYCWMTLYMI